jgi:hypothetical protein
MYQTPTTADFRRHLTGVTQATKRLAHDDFQNFVGKHSAKGLGGNFLRAVTDRFDELHAEAIDDVMHLIHDFASRTQLTATELANLARIELENLGAEIIVSIPTLHNADQVTILLQDEYKAKFQRRLDRASFLLLSPHRHTALICKQNRAPGGPPMCP